MVTETQKRIEAYRELLPGLREKVTAVAFLLALSVIMLTSASYAWLTISRAPEVTAVSTNIAANGSLEIALATGDGKIPPGDSKVGDSSAAEGQSIVNANKTWGNLINLNDEAYGLENLVLRPAQLNTAALLESPLYGSVFGGDGRVTQLSSNFGYAIWNLPEGDKPGYFGVSKDFGVRAISSTKIEAVGAAARYLRMVDDAKNKNLMAAGAYANLANNKDYMQSLATMMGKYMTARMNPDHATLSNPEIDVKDIQNLRDMYAAFLDCFDQEAEAMAEIANITLFLKHGTDENGNDNFTSYTKEKIYKATPDSLKADGITITNIEQFKKDRNTIAADLEKLKIIAESGSTLKWKDSGLNAIVNNLVDVGACTIGADNTPISSIGASNAMGYLSGTQEARITNGILYRFEERTGGYIEVKNLGISATVNRLGMTIPATVKANIKTTAPRDYNLFTNDRETAENLNTGNYQGGAAVAEDTYGLAIDFWVRTNSPISYLTLEGNVLSESKTVRATGKDFNGETVELWTLTFEIPASEGNEAEEIILDAYEIDGNYYDADTHSPVSEEELQYMKSAQGKMVEEITILGYEGENRVWGNEMMSVDATTQGGGSCYVYYADNPEDMERSLKLLESLKVAFVDKNGKLLAEAEMDTERYFADSGRVTVPLVLSTDSINLGEDIDGNATYAITALEQNVATRITAIVYLDGEKLENKNVLSASDIQGQLNIQFGSSQTLEPIENEELATKEIRVTASVDKKEFDYDTAPAGSMVSTFEINIEGTEPKKVTAYLIRQISATQGSRVDAKPDTPEEEPMTFTKNESGKWVAVHTFDAPGIYILRTVSLDGVDYNLPNTEAEPLPTVRVRGFTIEKFVCDEAENNHVNVLTADNSTTVNLKLKFVSDDETKMPGKVQARYLRDEDGLVVNADFAYNSTTQFWEATATFYTSGEYMLQYVVLDGKTVELNPVFWHTASVTLGMRVAVYTTSPHRFKYVPAEMAENEKLLAMQVMIMDNAGNEIQGRSGVELTYGLKGSGVKEMDADLTWNGKYYVGELATTGPGIWQFNRVEVKIGEKTNVLTVAKESPIFTIQSPEPPEYVGKTTNAYQYVPNGGAKMNVKLENASTATVQALITKDNGTQYEVISNSYSTDENGVTEFRFDVPKDANGYQDGNWTLKEIRIWDAFAADGTEYTEAEPLVFDLSDTANVTKVINRIVVTFAEDKSQNFNGAFMQSHNVNGLSVEIRDGSGKMVENAEGNLAISDVKLTFTYVNGSSEKMGGYTSTGLNNATAGATITVNLTDNGTGTKFEQTEGISFLYAGNYTTTVSYKVNGEETVLSESTLPTNAPKFTVSSVTPSVTISEVTTATTESIPTHITWKVSGWRSETTYTLSEYHYNELNEANNEATIYAKAVKGSNSGVSGVANGDAGFKAPTVKFRVAGVDSLSTIKFTIPAGSATAQSISITGNNQSSAITLGRTNKIREEKPLLTTYTLYEYLGHGDIEIKTVTLERSGVTYTIYLKKPIIIHNPSSTPVQG